MVDTADRLLAVISADRLGTGVWGGVFLKLGIVLSFMKDFSWRNSLQLATYLHYFLLIQADAIMRGVGV